MEGTSRRRTRATGFSPGGPRELVDAPRRQNRGGHRTTAASKAAPITTTRTAVAAESTLSAEAETRDLVDAPSVADGPASPCRGRGQTRSPRVRTRSSSPLESIGLPANRRSRSVTRVADAARSPCRGHTGLGRGRGKRAREETPEEVGGGSAEETGGEVLGSSVSSRPTKKLRAGDRGGESLRLQMEKENGSVTPLTASARVPSGARASVLRAGASALRYLGLIADLPRPVAVVGGGASPSTTTEVPPTGGPLSAAERPSGQSVAKSTGRPACPDGGAVASAILHERSGADLIAEQRRASDLKKLLKLGRRNVVPLKAPSECGSDDEEAARAAFRFTEELRPANLPTYDASTRYVGWKEGSCGMFVAEEEGSDNPKEDTENKSMKTALNWFSNNTDHVPTSEELVDILNKWNSSPKVFRAPSPSDPWSSDEFDSETGKIIAPRQGKTARPIPPPRPPRRPRITAQSIPSFTGRADAHLPLVYHGTPYAHLPLEMQEHPLSWRILEQEAIWKAKREALIISCEADDRRYMDSAAARVAAKEKRAQEVRAARAAKAAADEKRAEEAAHAAKIAEEKRVEEDARAIKIANEAAQKTTHENVANATVATPARTSKKRRNPPPNPPEWEGLDIDPRTHIPVGMYGLFYGINYYTDSSEDELEFTLAKKAEQEKERKLQRDNFAKRRRANHQSLALPPNVSPIAEETIDVAAIVDAIPNHEFDALKKVLRPSAPSRLNNNTKIDNTVDSDKIDNNIVSTNYIENNVDSGNEINTRIDSTNQIDNTANISYTETSPQVEVIPRAPRTSRPIAEPRPHRTPEIKKLFDRKLLSASQFTAGPSESEPMAAFSEPESTPSLDVVSSMSLVFEISPNIQSIVDAIPKEEYKLLDEYMRAQSGFTISDEIMAMVEAIPDAEFDGMDLDLSYAM